MVNMNTRRPKALNDWELEEYLIKREKGLYLQFLSGGMTLDQIRKKLGIKWRE